VSTTNKRNIYEQPEIAIWPSKTGSTDVSESMLDFIEISTANLGFIDHGELEESDPMRLQ